MTELQILQLVAKDGGSTDLIALLNRCREKSLNKTDNLIQIMCKRKYLAFDPVSNTRIILLPDGYSRLDELQCRQKQRRIESIRWLVTTAIALAAFIKSFFG